MEKYMIDRKRPCRFLLVAGGKQQTFQTQCRLLEWERCELTGWWCRKDRSRQSSQRSVSLIDTHIDTKLWYEESVCPKSMSSEVELHSRTCEGKPVVLPLPANISYSTKCGHEEDDERQGWRPEQGTSGWSLRIHIQSCSVHTRTETRPRWTADLMSRLLMRKPKRSLITRIGPDYFHPN